MGRSLVCIISITSATATVVNTILLFLHLPSTGGAGIPYSQTVECHQRAWGSSFLERVHGWRDVEDSKSAFPATAVTSVDAVGEFDLTCKPCFISDSASPPKEPRLSTNTNGPSGSNAGTFQSDQRNSNNNRRKLFLDSELYSRDLVGEARGGASSSKNSDSRFPGHQSTQLPQEQHPEGGAQDRLVEEEQDLWRKRIDQQRQRGWWSEHKQWNMD